MLDLTVSEPPGRRPILRRDVALFCAGASSGFVDEVLDRTLCVVWGPASVLAEMFERRGVPIARFGCL